MKRRSPATPLLLPLVTFGIYSLVWLVSTKASMNAVVATKVPTAWLLIVPIANFVWFWRYAGAVDRFTKGGLSQAAAFWLLLLLGPIGAAIVQSTFNKSL
jgi:hypothetical protein